MTSTSLSVWRPLACDNDEGATHVTPVEETDVTTQASPHTRTVVPVGAKPLPVMVSVAPPASVVVVGAKPVTASCEGQGTGCRCKNLRKPQKEVLPSP